MELGEVDRSRLALVGGKGANLGELWRIAGVQVPPGYCVTTEAFGEVLAQTPPITDLPDQLSNLHLLASALVEGAPLRTETRGSHWWEDFPETADRWLVCVVMRFDPGKLVIEKPLLRSAEMDGVKP